MSDARHVRVAPRDPPRPLATLIARVVMSGKGAGRVALLPEPFEVRAIDVDKAARAAREAAARVRETGRRRAAPAPEPDPTAEDGAPAT